MSLSRVFLLFKKKKKPRLALVEERDRLTNDHRPVSTLRIISLYDGWNVYIRHRAIVTALYSMLEPRRADKKFSATLAIPRYTFIILVKGVVSRCFRDESLRSGIVHIHRTQHATTLHGNVSNLRPIEDEGIRTGDASHVVQGSASIIFFPIIIYLAELLVSHSLFRIPFGPNRLLETLFRHERRSMAMKCKLFRLPRFFPPSV